MSEHVLIRELPEFDMAEHLRNDDDIAAYLSMVLEERNTDELVRALGYIAKDRGMTQLAKENGLECESLYRVLRAGSNPQFDTIQKILKALNFELRAVHQSPAGSEHRMC